MTQTIYAYSQGYLCAPRVEYCAEKRLDLRRGIMQADDRATVHHLVTVRVRHSISAWGRLRELKHSSKHGRACGEDRSRDAEKRVSGA